MSTAMKALRMAKYVKGLVNSELHSSDFTLNTTVTTTPTVSHLTDVAIGDDFTQRTGRKIRLKSIQIRGDIELNAVATNSTFRMIVFKDTMNIGTPPTASQIVANTDALRNPEPNFLNRFKILMDRTIQLNQKVDANLPKVTFNWYRKLDLPVTYTGTASTDEGKNSLWLLLVSDEASNAPDLDFTSRIRFRDN